MQLFVLAEVKEALRSLTRSAACQTVRNVVECFKILFNALEPKVALRSIAPVNCIDCTCYYNCTELLQNYAHTSTH